MTGGNVIGSGDSIGGTVLGAEAATDTLILIDDEVQQALADAGWTLLIDNVSDVLIAEETEGGENGVGFFKRRLRPGTRAWI